MHEQNPNERQPKVRRPGSGGAEEPRSGVTRAESTGQAEQEEQENVYEKLSRAGEEASRATDEGVRQVANVLSEPFRASQRALDEWTHFFGRAVERNARAASDLMECHSVPSVMRWQRELVQSNAEDWLETSFAAFGISVRKVAHAEAE
jgi:Phasin protein